MLTAPQHSRAPRPRTHVHFLPVSENSDHQPPGIAELPAQGVRLRHGAEDGIACPSEIPQAGAGGGPGCLACSTGLGTE